MLCHLALLRHRQKLHIVMQHADIACTAGATLHGEVHRGLEEVHQPQQRVVFEFGDAQRLRQLARQHVHAVVAFLQGTLVLSVVKVLHFGVISLLHL